jgi:hypothetical protein
MKEEKLREERTERLRSASRIVIKVGTATVTGVEGEFCTERMTPIVRSIARLSQSGKQVARPGHETSLRSRGPEPPDGCLQKPFFGGVGEGGAGTPDGG